MPCYADGNKICFFWCNIAVFNSPTQAIISSCPFFPILMISTHWLSGRVFANGPGDRGSISGRVIPKTQKVLLDTSLLNTQHYKVRFKGKVEQSRERSSTFPTPRCISYWKGSFWVALDYGRQIYLLTIYVYIYYWKTQQTVIWLL